MTTPSGEELTLQLATVDDWPDIWPLWHQVVATGDTYSYEPLSTFEQGCAMWIGDGDREETWIARRAAGVVGTYHVAPNQPGAGNHVANASYMVDTAVRGGGVGRQLVEHSLERAAELGFLGVQFNAVAATNVGAIGLYEKLGFTTIGRVPGAFRHPVAGRVDLLVMYRELDVG